MPVLLFELVVLLCAALVRVTPGQMPSGSAAVVLTCSNKESTLPAFYRSQHALLGTTRLEQC